MLTSPSCNGCNYFKKKGMKKYAEKYAETADFWWINAESEFGESKLTFDFYFYYFWHRNSWPKIDVPNVAILRIGRKTATRRAWNQ